MGCWGPFLWEGGAGLWMLDDFSVPPNQSSTKPNQTKPKFHLKFHKTKPFWRAGRCGVDSLGPHVLAPACSKDPDCQERGNSREEWGPIQKHQPSGGSSTPIIALVYQTCGARIFEKFFIDVVGAQWGGLAGTAWIRKYKKIFWLSRSRRETPKKTL